jgi:hypothetical protein
MNEIICSKASQGWLFIYTFTEFMVTGISSQVLPLSVRPALFFYTPPHCLKKNGTLAPRH